MLPYSPLLPYAAITFLLHMIPASSFDVYEDDEMFEFFRCSATLSFNTAAFLSDMTFELPCRCKPTEFSSVVWYYQRNSEDRTTRVLTDFNGTVAVDSKHIRSSDDIVLRFSIRMFALIVFKARLDDSGLYICGSEDGNFFSGFSVDIQNSKNTYVAFEEKGGHPQPDLIGEGFVAFTTFWDWTTCDRCQVRGEQRQIGVCYVNSSHLYVRPQNKINRGAHSERYHVAPCGSEFVPPNLKTLIASRRPEIIIRSCTAPCRKPKKSTQGLLSTFVDYITDLKDLIPWFPKVPMQFHTHPLGSRLTITCPGARLEQAVAWDKDDHRLYLTEYLIGVNKEMRVFIDHRHHLNFRPVKLNDTGIYYCWLQGMKIAGFRLAVQVEPAEKRRFTDSESVFAMKTLGVAFVFCFIMFILIYLFGSSFLSLRRLLRRESPGAGDEDAKGVP